MKKDQIVELVKKKLDSRSKLGIGKYNTTLFDSPDGFYVFLNHLQEELFDASLYIEKLKQINSSGHSDNESINDIKVNPEILSVRKPLDAEGSWNCLSCGRLHSSYLSDCQVCGKK